MSTPQYATGLGSSPAHARAELIAGVRAEYHPTVETIALARSTARTFSRVLVTLAPGQFGELVTSRDAVFLKLLRSHLGEITRDRSQQPLIHLEVATGFNPRGLQIARAHPDVYVYEVLSPCVRQEKTTRLARAGIPLPPNFSLVDSHNFNETLRERFQKKPVDSIILEGLTAYSSPAQNAALLQTMHDVLRHKGLFLCDFVHHSPQMMRYISRFGSSFTLVFQRMSKSNPRTGQVHSPEDVQQLLQMAGFASASITDVGTLAKQLGIAHPPANDYLLIAETTR